MAPSLREMATHSTMLGRQVPRLAATRFNHGEYQRPSKRLRTLESLESDGHSIENNSDDESVSGSSTLYRHEIPDSDEEHFSDEDVLNTPPHRHTDLENALPPADTDVKAIAEYELMRAAVEEPDSCSNSSELLSTRKRTTGRSSIYVDAFNLALERVLEDEAHLFDKAEKEIFNQWNRLEYEAKYLYVRLFLRKTAAWHRLSRLGYHQDISNIELAAEVLQIRRDLPGFSTAPPIMAGQIVPPQELFLGSSFTFADASDLEIKTLEEASTLLNLEELKLIAKEAKVHGKTKAELLKALQRASQSQSGLRWTSLKQPDSEDAEALSNGVEDMAAQNIYSKNRDDYFVRKILGTVGRCIRLSTPGLKLFERVHLVFYRSTEWTEKSLTTIILAKISRRNFPDYIVSRSAAIFESRSALLEFESSLRTQFRVDNILEFNGSPGKEGLAELLRIFDDVYPRWKALLEEEQNKEDRVYERGEGAYLRRFSPAWVYTRIVHKAAYALGKLKMYEREHTILIELLDQNLFHVARRGDWYQRKALIEEHYMAPLRPLHENTDADRDKRYWNRVSLETCEQGLRDRDCHVIYHYDLQKRIEKLEKRIKVAKRDQHDFGHVSLAKPMQRTVYGIRVKRGEVHKKVDQAKERRISTKTIWIDEREGGGECSVEEMCLSWYRDQGWKGYHCEGGIIRTLFAYLFYDVLFQYIPNVFQTPYQTCPLDLHTDAFCPSRASEINHRLVEITNGNAERLIRDVDSKSREKKTCVVGLNWEFELDDLLEIVSCFDGAALATICKVMAEEYRHRSGGIPDLFLWNPTKREVMFSEVKSENDRLSDTQRLWIHVLTSAAITVELCNAVAREVQTR